MASALLILCRRIKRIKLIIGIRVPYFYVGELNELILLLASAYWHLHTGIRVLSSTNMSKDT